MWIVALVCIIIGVLQAAIEEQVLFASLVWFVLAIAFNTLAIGPLPFVRKRD